ncbi:MAG: hypothetical protein AAF726_08270 [Planctomycetota bacterium]
MNAALLEAARRTWPALALVPLALPASEAHQKTVLRYEPPTDRALSLAVTETHDLTLRTLSTRVGDAEPVEGSDSFRLRTRVDTVFADEHADTDGSPIRRRYLDAAATLTVSPPLVEGEEAPDESRRRDYALMSPFRDVSVVYVPADGQPEGFGRHYDARSLPEPLLPKLSAPFDWAALLPPARPDGTRSAGIGDSWTIPPEALESLIAGGGFLNWRSPKPKKGEEEPPQKDERLQRVFSTGVGGNLYVGFDGRVTGSADASLAQVGQDGDVSWAEIVIAFDVRLLADRSDFVDDKRLESLGEDDVEMLGANLGVALRGTATLRWDLTAHRPSEATVEAAETIAMNVRLSPPGGAYFEQAMGMEGRLQSRLSFDVIPATPVRRTVGR